MQPGKFFYRVCNPKGVRLHSRADAKSSLREQVLPEGQVLEAGEKWTPAGSPLTFVTVDMDRGFIIERSGEKVGGVVFGRALCETICAQESERIRYNCIVPFWGAGYNIVR